MSKIKSQQSLETAKKVKDLLKVLPDNFIFLDAVEESARHLVHCVSEMEGFMEDYLPDNAEDKEYKEIINKMVRSYNDFLMFIEKNK